MRSQQHVYCHSFVRGVPEKLVTVGFDGMEKSEG